MIGFNRNSRELRAYGDTPATDLTSVRNTVSLRADLKQQDLDRGQFIFAPYAGSIVSIFVENIAQDFAYEYHLRKVKFPARIPQGYLFVRFAFNILKFLCPGLVAAAALLDDPKSGNLPLLKRKHGEVVEADGADVEPRKKRKGGSRRRAASGDGTKKGNSGLRAGTGKGKDNRPVLYEAQDAALLISKHHDG
ncbi:hypothetical protein B0H19DRAFT_1057681 [Mycena capillaripes]|nr:hypothetical protein B0H19DRAFT_1057681 [Mycena capillaripes]